MANDKLDAVGSNDEQGHHAERTQDGTAEADLDPPEPPRLRDLRGQQVH